MTLIAAITAIALAVESAVNLYLINRVLVIKVFVCERPDLLFSLVGLGFWGEATESCLIVSRDVSPG